jgi:ATP-dependent DNA helicase RecG
MAIGANTFSAKDILEKMGLKDKSNSLENYLYPAIKLDIVELLYTEQPKHPRWKYRLTKKGKILLK